MNKMTVKAFGFAVVAFGAAWQATNFALDYRSILGAVVAAAMGAASPKGSTPAAPQG